MNYLGCSGWSYNHWINEFYPKDLERTKWLPYYAKSFNTVEINMSFYRFPWPNMVKGWYNKTPKDFKLTFKANRQITHIKKLKNVKTPINKFYKLADLAKEKLGCILFQLHPRIAYNKKLLTKFVKQLNPKYNNVIEFRNQTWFNNECYDILKKNNITYCIVSSPKYPEHFKTTSKIAYLRLHGREGWYKYNYTKKELKEIASKLKKLKYQDLYVYFNNDFNANAIRNCLSLKRVL